EYALYERLDARSIIASPFSPSPTGFLVIRNPSRYLNHPEALFIFAYGRPKGRFLCRDCDPALKHLGRILPYL
ncbi:MAG: hypothetical protein SPK62_01965, partial [Gemmiger sp.]|nr:hypothetical protein [Gemmiger sp.]